MLAITLLPPLIVNTTLGFLLFSSHSLLSLYLARLPYFQRRVVQVDDTVVVESKKPDLTLDDFIDDLLSRDIFGAVDGDYGQATPGAPEPAEEEITLETIIRGPKTVPAHPTLLAAIAGAGAGIIQGMAFTPIENIVRYVPLTRRNADRPGSSSNRQPPPRPRSHVSFICRPRKRRPSMARHPRVPLRH